MRVWLIAAAIVAVLGGGVAVLASDLLGDDAGAQALAPSDAVVFVHVTLDPSLGQKRALASLRQRLPQAAEQQLEESVSTALTSALDEVGLDFDNDVKPWLGGEVAAFVTTDAAGEPSGAAVLETTDAEAALDATRRAVVAEFGQPADAMYRDHAYWVVPRNVEGEPETSFGVLDGFLVLGTTGGVRSAIDAAEDGGLDGTAAYGALVASLTPERLLTYWVDTPRLFEAVTAQLPPGAGAFTDSPLVAQQQPSAGAVLATADAVVFEAVSTQPAQDAGLFQTAPADAGLMASLPGSAWLSVVMPGIGTNLAAALDSTPDAAQVEREFSQATGLDLRDEVLSWMGDGAVFITGDSLQSLRGALVVQSSDAAATTSFLRRMADTATQQGLAVNPTRAGNLEGFELADGQLPLRVTALGGERLVIAVEPPGSGDEGSVVGDVIGDSAPLSDNAVFSEATAALGEGYAPILFLDVERLTQVVLSAFGESSVPQEFTQAQPYLQRLSHVVAGTREDGDLIMQRIVIGTKAP